MSPVQKYGFDLWAQGCIETLYFCEECLKLHLEQVALQPGERVTEDCDSNIECDGCGKI
jgi:hypothetical protein